MPTATHIALESEYKKLLKAYRLVGRFIPVPRHLYDRRAALSIKVFRRLQFVFQWYRANRKRHTFIKPWNLLNAGRDDPLNELGTDVSYGFRRLGHFIQTPVFVGVFPTGHLDAHIRIVPGGALVLVNSALKQLLHQVTKIVGLSMRQFDPRPRLSDGALSEEFAKVIYSFLRFGDSREAPPLPLMDERTTFTSTAVLYESERFVVAHEYAHLVAGHLAPSALTTVNTPVGELEVLSVTREQERIADDLACRVMLELRDDHPIKVFFKDMYPIFPPTGPLLYFALDNLLTDVAVANPHLFGLSESLRRGIAKYARPGDFETLSKIAPLDRPPANERFENCKRFFLGCHQEHMDLANGIVEWVNQQTQIINDRLSRLSRLDARRWVRTTARL